MKNNEEDRKKSAAELFAILSPGVLIGLVMIGFSIAEEISQRQKIAEWRKLPLSERGGYINEDGKYIPPSYLGRAKDTRSRPQPQCNPKVVNQDLAVQSLCNPKVLNPDAGF